ncbi:mammalian cell entry protein [Mycobacterium sp.]|uniref:mammalian cell entry protein n=1 Tax=Mycobacterium sp. TaxID=1785 RepID=UPI003C7127F3
MEDQQPAEGDLTDEISDRESGFDLSADTVEAEAGQRESDAGDETDDGTTEDDEPTADEAGEATEAGRRHRRSAGRWSVVAAVVAAVLFVCSAAFAGATLQPYVKERATVATKLRIARTAANAITTLWTYNPQNMDKLADRAAQYLSGDFQAAYRKYIDAIVAPNKQAQISNSTQVTGAAVESLNGADATAIVYTNTSSTSPATKDIPSLKYLSYRLVMKRDHARWLVTKMTTITSLDLTPKF